MPEIDDMGLDDKITLAKIRIKQWFDHWNGQVVVSFSGGLDSTALLHLVRSLYPDVPAVFADTGLEYPEIRNFVKTVKNVVWLRPEMAFQEVVRVHGYPVVGKMTARKIRALQEKKPSTANTRRLYETGVRMDGKYSRHSKLPKKWKHLVEGGFKVSEKCCDMLKTGPLVRHSKETGLLPFIGTRMAEGGVRAAVWQKEECNTYGGRRPRSAPLTKWADADVRRYIQENEVPYSLIYADREISGELVQGEKRTGCMFCMFGVHMEKGENRFQRMARTHPRHWNTCINKLGMREVLAAIGVSPDPCDSSVESDK